MTRNLTRFWVPYAAACATWALTGAWAGVEQYARRPMSMPAQLALRGGQCVGDPGKCDATNSCVSDGTSSSCKGNTCSYPNTPCNAYQINGSNEPACVQNNNATTKCVYSTNQVKCYDFLDCNCDMDLNCVGTTTQEDIGICLQGT